MVIRRALVTLAIVLACALAVSACASVTTITVARYGQTSMVQARVRGHVIVRFWVGNLQHVFALPTASAQTRPPSGAR